MRAYSLWKPFVKQAETGNKKVVLTQETKQGKGNGHIDLEHKNFVGAITLETLGVEC